MAAVQWARGAASAFAIAVSTLSAPALAQGQSVDRSADLQSTQVTDATQVAEPAEASAAAQEDSTEIVVTAQRQSERLQDVPIAVTAFDAAALEKQQIANSSDLQLTLPNVTFTKTNFTTSSFTIRGASSPSRFIDPSFGLACGSYQLCDPRVDWSIGTSTDDRLACDRCPSPHGRRRGSIQPARSPLLDLSERVCRRK